MTAKEELLERAPRWSEHEAAVALRAVEREQSGEERLVDGWGDLDRFSAHASRGVLRHMAEEEEATGLSWEEHRPR